MIADLTADGLQLGFSDLIMAARPETCGQAMEVPESIKKRGGFLPASFTTESLSGHEARMATPGAATSGCNLF